MTLKVIVNVHPNYYWMLRSYLKEIGKYKQVQVIIWSQNQKRFLEQDISDSKLVLVGSFRDFSKKQSSGRKTEIDDDLLRIFESNLGSNFWHITSDLDNSISNLLMGQSLKHNLDDQIKSMEPRLLAVFNGIIWGYEDLPEDHHQVDIDLWKWRELSPDSLKLRKDQLKETRDSLCAKFERRITWHHCINLPPRQLFDYSYLNYRTYDVALIGSLYSTRAASLEMLRRSDLKIYPHHNFFEEDLALLSLVRKYRNVRVHTNIPRLSTVRTEFILQQWGFARSSAAWMDSGYFGYFVRKYLEAAVSGAALVGYLNSSLRNLGLAHMENFIEISSHEKLSKTETQYLTDHENHRRLAGNTLKWIDDNHSAKRRASQIIYALADLNDKSVFGFYHGTFKRKA